MAGTLVLSPSNNDSVLRLFVGEGFTCFANDTIRAALESHSLVFDPEDPPLRVLRTVNGPSVGPLCKLECVRWYVDTTLMWQQINRRIDEVTEILRSFYRSHNTLQATLPVLVRSFFTGVSRRAIRPTPSDEFLSLERWMTRVPPSLWGSNGGFSGSGFFGWSEYAGSDEEDEEAREWGDAPPFTLA